MQAQASFVLSEGRTMDCVNDLRDLPEHEEST